MLDSELLGRRLAERGLSLARFVPPETGSTNNDAKEYAKTAPKGPILFAADRQTAGRGRQGKTFVSPPGGLYMSLLLPTDLSPADSVGVTGCAAVAACRAAEECAAVPARIKWVNDILVPLPSSGLLGKAAGILCERTETEAGRYLVIGIGLNVGSAPRVEGANFPPAPLARPGHPVEPEGLCACLTENFLSFARNGFRFSDAVREYRERSVVLGQTVTFVRNGISRTGTAREIDCGGALIADTPDGPVRLDSGEISVRLTGNPFAGI